MSKRHICAGLLATALATPAAAQDVTLSWGATLTSNYISRGFTQTENRWAFQPYAELGFGGGFYAGIWASNVRFEGDDDRVEIDLYGGYRFEVNGASFDLGYARYIYDRSGDCCGEFFGLVDIEAGSGGAFGGVYIDPEDDFRITDAHVGVRLTLMDPVTASALVGRSGGQNYGNIGVAYAVNDNWELDLRYHRGDVRRVVVSASVNF